MSDVVVNPAESSPAPVIAPPKDPIDYAEWRQTGHMPDAAKPAPKPEAAAASSDAPVDGAESESASEAGTRQEPRASKPRSNAETRLTELLADLKRAGLTPAELKTFQREAAKTETKQEAPAPKVETPADTNAPVRPKLEDFDSFDLYEVAREKYYEQLADHRAEMKIQEREQRARDEASRRETSQKLAEAAQRYGEGSSQTITDAAQKVFSDQAIPAAIKAVLNDSPVLVDLMYTLGKGADLQEFIDLAKSDPGKAIRKAVLLEQLVTEELKAGKSAAPAGETARDESGKFVSDKPANKKVTEAPAPPRESSGRNAAPPDEVESAATANDFQRFRSAANRRDMQQRQGR